MEVSLSGLVAEARDWRKHFSMSGLLTALVIGLAPSAWDIGADFRDKRVKTNTAGYLLN